MNNEHYIVVDKISVTAGGKVTDYFELKFFCFHPELQSVLFTLDHFDDNGKATSLPFSPVEIYTNHAAPPRIWQVRIEVGKIPTMGEVEARAFWKRTDTSKTPAVEVIDNDLYTFPAGNKVAPQSAAAGPATQFSPATEAPQISPILASTPAVAPVTGVLTDADSKRKAIVAILSHMESGLMAGLGKAWFMCDNGRWTTRDGKSYCDHDSSTLNDSELEEQWAQVVTEMLDYVPYFGPSLYGNFGPTGNDLLPMTTRSNPSYPIGVACQHSTTMGLITRGLTNVASNAVDSHGEEPSKIGGRINKTGSTYYVASSFKTANELSETKNITAGNITKFDIREGSIYQFDPSPHIAFVLRVLNNAGKVQLFDTGGMNFPSGYQSPMKEQEEQTGLARISGSSVIDFPGADGVISGPAAKSKKYQGLWVPPPFDKTELINGITASKKMRPMAFVRVVMAQRDIAWKDTNKNDFLFASALLPAWWNDTAKGVIVPFSPARFIWALRGHPFADKIRVYLLFDVPRRMAKDGKTIFDHFLDNSDPRTYTKTLKNGDFYSAVDFMSMPDGTVAAYSRKNYSEATSSTGKTSEWAYNSSTTFNPRPRSNRFLNIPQTASGATTDINMLSRITPASQVPNRVTDINYSGFDYYSIWLGNASTT